MRNRRRRSSRRWPAPAPAAARSYLVFFDWDKATLTDRARAIVELLERPQALRDLLLPTVEPMPGEPVEIGTVHVVIGRENRLKRALAGVVEDYDFVLIDCPPSLGLLSVNGLTAANEIMVPVQCEYFALEGLGQLLRNVNLVRDQLNPSLDLRYIVCTMYARSTLANQVVDVLRQSPELGRLVCKTVIPRQVKLSEAPSFGQPIITFDSGSRGATAYRGVAKEVSGGPAERTR